MHDRGIDAGTCATKLDRTRLVAISQMVADELCHTAGTAVICLDRGARHVVSRDAIPSDVISRAVGELAHECALRAPVPFPEWMQHIDFAQVVPCPLAEFVRIEAAQVVLAGKLTEKVAGGAVDVLRLRKARRALLDHNSAQLARPRVDIAKQMAMDGAQVPKVEPFGCPHSLQLIGTHRRHCGFDAVQLGLVAGTDVVSQQTR
ncbi:MAG: hypothetical protein GAK38_04567 [Xylophilus sp.]|nr:MAG: hypothetical protein GAK38_04567 [Xylophilus sp.]